MRRFLGLFALLSLAACSDGIDRLEGDGCQPACRDLAIVDDPDMQRGLICTPPSHDADECAVAGEGSVVCPGSEIPTCGENGPPTCPSGAIPYCAR